MYNTIYPNYAKAYLGVNNRQTARKQNEEKSAHSSNPVENNLAEEKKQQSANSYFPNGEKVAIDYTKHKIGIEQVLKDFRNTANAIGAPEDIRNEVNSYLSLVESQSQKSNPNQQIIQSNLKNASQILDEYITNTLKKPSKVVENWVDALFLQQVDYKIEKNQTPLLTEEEGIEEDVLTPLEQEEQPIEDISPDNEPISSEKNIQENSSVYIPKDIQLKRMFIQAKKYASIDEKDRALYEFQNAMDYAESIGDYETSAMIHYEQGKLYDDFNNLEDALYNYHAAANQSSNDNVKAKSYLSMGKIYDDFVKYGPAVEHYALAVSYAGEADNLNLQSKALSDLAQLHTEKYDRSNALMFMSLASIVSNETKNSKTQGLISLKSARMCEKLGEKAKALNLYGNSTEAFSQINDNEHMAKNYVSAAEIMLQYGNKAKAKKLLSKAYLSAQKTENNELKALITQSLSEI